MTINEQKLHDALTKSLSLYKEQKSEYQKIIKLLKTALSESNTKLTKSMSLNQEYGNTLESSLAEISSLGKSLTMFTKRGIKE